MFVTQTLPNGYHVVAQPYTGSFFTCCTPDPATFQIDIHDPHGNVVEYMYSCAPCLDYAFDVARKVTP